jgi:hypothetical protein
MRFWVKWGTNLRHSYHGVSNEVPRLGLHWFTSYSTA